MSILAYHSVDRRFDWGATRVTPRQFERQVAWAAGKGYSFVTVSEYLERKRRQPGEKIVALTFDDGFESVYRYAYPVLAKYGAKATVFIIAGYVGQWNTWDVNIGWIRFRHLTWGQIKELSQSGWEIGSHGLSHLDLTRLPVSRVLKEINAAKRLIEDRINVPAKAISYPFGNVNARVADMARGAGHDCGFVMGRSNKKIAAPLAVPRLGVYLFDSLLSFRQKTDGRIGLFYRSLQKFLDICSDGTVIVKQGLLKRPKNCA